MRVEAEFDGEPLDVSRSGRIVRAAGADVTYDAFSGELQPEDVVVLFLEQAPNALLPCPVGITPARDRDSSINKTGRGGSYRIKTSAPVSAYSIFPFGGARAAATSATLLLPVPAWRTDYIVANAWERSRVLGTSPTTQIVAAEDDTEVTIVGSAPIYGSAAVEAAEQGVPHTYRLRRGELLQIAQSEELTGSLISANKNVAVWGGHECMMIPHDQLYCDQAALQLFPVEAWGREYVAVPYMTRRVDKAPEEYFFSIIAAADDTTLTYEPRRPRDAPTTLSKGRSARFSTVEPFVVKSQDEDHPIAVYAHMSSGGQFSGAELTDGDPDFTTVVPTEQYLDSYVFYVDATHRNSQLVVVRTRPEGKDFEPVILDCAGPLDGWTPIGSEGKYEYTRLYLTRWFTPQKVGTGTCGHGRRKIESAGAFDVAVWGTHHYGSYSYPGGAAIRRLNSVETVVR